MRWIPARSASVVFSSLLAIAAVLLTGGAAQAGDVDPKDLAQLVKEVEAEPVHDLPIYDFDARQGPDDAAVRVIVFSDFQCRPYCARGADIARDLVAEHGDRIQLVFKNYPLNGSCNAATTTRMHEYACAAAMGAQCAGEQGRFWAFHDAVFATATLSDTTFAASAADIGLDMAEWRGCLASDRPEAQVRAQAADGAAAGVSGTPTWFVEGHKMTGSFAAKMGAVVRFELARAETAE